MKNIIKNIGLSLFAGATLFSCQPLVDDINDPNPNKLNDVSGEKVFNGMEISQVLIQSGYLNMVGNIWSGHFNGFNNKFKPFEDYNFDLNATEQSWRNIYVGIVKQGRTLRSIEKTPNKKFFDGASKFLEAYALATGASLFGDIPFSEISADDKPSPKFDGQKDVYAGLQTLLDEAIKDLGESGVTGGVVEDIYFGGDSNKWIKAAYTLKTRMYMETREYTKAYANVSKGIDSQAGSLRYTPPATGNGDENLLYSINSTGTKGDLRVDANFIKLLEDRNNAKTNDLVRRHYFVGGENADDINYNKGSFSDIGTPMDLITYQENLLHWAELELRQGNFAEALAKLNAHRANVKGLKYFHNIQSEGTNYVFDKEKSTVNVPKADFKFDAYADADFDGGGIENADAIDKNNALMREIVEERYVSFFGTMLAFSDIRRYRKDDAAVQVPIKKKKADKEFPERMLYPNTETLTNPNTPDVADIFVKTPINE